MAGRRVRTYSRLQASTKRSTSSEVLAQPRLTRIALAASSASIPMAASTWDGPTLRDEQAERQFPDDDYDLTPTRLADIDPELHEPSLAWGAAKAFMMKARHRELGG